MTHTHKSHEKRTDNYHISGVFCYSTQDWSCQLCLFANHRQLEQVNVAFHAMSRLPQR